MTQPSEASRDSRASAASAPRIAANARRSRPFAREDQTIGARIAILARYQGEADPTGTLPPDKLAPLAKAKAKALEHTAWLNAAKPAKAVSAPVSQQSSSRPCRKASHMGLSL